MLDIDVKALVDELAAKYPADVLETAITNGLKNALVGRTITVEFKDGALKVTVG